MQRIIWTCCGVPKKGCFLWPYKMWILSYEPSIVLCMAMTLKFIIQLPYEIHENKCPIKYDFIQCISSYCFYGIWSHTKVSWRKQLLSHFHWLKSQSWAACFFSTACSCLPAPKLTTDSLTKFFISLRWTPETV